MHIPDGYLSPQTCVVMLAATAPFWVTATRRLKKTLTTKTAPLLSIFSAFSFVIMMFNAPVPGGTTAHAVGGVLMAIILGPWAAVIGVSIALFIQALFFGDGGILAFGANAFNMAVVLPIVGYWVYRLIAQSEPMDSPRHFLAAAIGGYVGINASALCAAVEFGIQPIFSHTANGAALYCPYNLSQAIPAMLFAHLTIAGFAEAMVTGGVLVFLKRSMPDVLTGIAGEAQI